MIYGSTELSKYTFRTSTKSIRTPLGYSTEEKVNIPNEQILSWIKQANAHLNEKQKETRKVALIFAKCGLDSYFCLRGAKLESFRTKQRLMYP